MFSSFGVDTTKYLNIARIDRFLSKIPEFMEAHADMQSDRPK